MALVPAVVAAYGVYLLYTSAAFGWHGLGIGPPGAGRSRPKRPLQRWMAGAGLDDVRLVEVIAVVAVLFVVGSGLAFAIFGGVLPPLAVGAFAATFPLASARARRERQMARARDAWPRMIEEIRLLAGSVGRSIPQALFEVGGRGPEELRPAFAAAYREWLISTDLPRAIAVLKQRLADPTADAACETLLLAHEVGGSDLDRRLAALVEDRVRDLQGRKDALAKQAGVRFARRFVLIVPLGMALAGLTIGNGRAAYSTGLGQLAVALAIAVLIGCWAWAGRLMRLPQEQRVFAE